MTTYTIITILLIIFSVIYLKFAERFNIVDKPNERSSHTIPTIRGGGILFLIALWLFFIAANFQYPYLVLGVTLIAGISFIDDLKTLSSKLRLPFQFFAIALVLLEIGFVDSTWWSLLIILIMGVGFINMYNFMDGINGITGLYSLSVLSGLYMLNVKEQLVDPDLLRILMISLVVFGYYNFRKKARFFAGDIGSISIAVLLFFIGATFYRKFQAPVFILWIVVYGADSMTTIAYRKYLGQNIMEPHRLHIYQKLVDVYKISHLKVAGAYALIQVIANMLILKTYKAPLNTQYIILFSVLLMFFIGYVIAFYIIEKKKNRLVAQQSEEVV